MKNKLYYLLFFASSIIWSQQDAQYSQYIYNMSVVNPAYTTNDIGAINFGLLHRSQWVGVEGAPTTTDFFVHAPLSENIEVGLSLVHDKLGKVAQETNVAADFAYKLNLGGYNTLSFGVKAGINMLNLKLSGLNLESDIIDPNFNEDIKKGLVNIGAGVFFNTNNFYVGISVPNFIKGRHLEQKNGQFSGVDATHLFFNAGYVLNLNDNYKLKPSILAKYTEGAPLIFDLNANVLYQNKIEFGIGYRFKDEIGALINFRVTPELRIGYAYDYTTSNLNTFSSGSHEILLLYDFNTLFTGYNKSPRFF